MLFYSCVNLGEKNRFYSPCKQGTKKKKKIKKHTHKRCKWNSASFKFLLFICKVNTSFSLVMVKMLPSVPHPKDSYEKELQLDRSPKGSETVTGLLHELLINWDEANTKSLRNLTPKSSGPCLSPVVDLCHSKTVAHNSKFCTEVQCSLSDRFISGRNRENLYWCTDFCSKFSHCKKRGSQLFCPFWLLGQSRVEGKEDKTSSIHHNLKSSTHHNFTFAECHNFCRTLPFFKISAPAPFNFSQYFKNTFVGTNNNSIVRVTN